MKGNQEVLEHVRNRLSLGVPGEYATESEMLIPYNELTFSVVCAYHGGSSKEFYRLWNEVKVIASRFLGL